MIKAAIFDMDGTILDTVEDLTDSVNYAMEAAGHRHDFTLGHTKAFFGSGARAAVMRALCFENGMALEELEFVGTSAFSPDESLKAETERVLKAFQGYYPAHCEIKTRPYRGINDAVRELRKNGIITAVVSNKMDKAVQALCEKHFAGLFDAQVGENEPAVRRKPAPDMILKIMDEFCVSAAETVYIGDSEIDMQTAENAGLRCICVSWGFRSEEFLIKHGAEIIVHDVSELSRVIVDTIGE